MAKISVTNCPAGPALDAAVAKAKGWRVERWSDETDGGFHLVDENGDHVRAWSVDKDPRWRWSPSTDIAAASDLWISLRNTTKWTAFCDALMSVIAPGYSAMADYYFLSEITLLAITRAFLLAHGVTEVEVVDD